MYNYLINRGIQCTPRITNMTLLLLLSSLLLLLVACLLTERQLGHSSAWTLLVNVTAPPLTSPVASYLTSLSLIFFICTMEIEIGLTPTGYL